MKKFLVFTAFVLLAAGCGQTTYTQSGTTTYDPQATQTPADQNVPTSPPDTILPAPSSTPAATGAVKIKTLNPSSGPAGITVTITGSGFSKTGNQIMFGQFSGRYHPDGSQDNVIATANSQNGTTLSFTVPNSGPSGLLCDKQRHCLGIMTILLTPGSYPVSVSNLSGSSNTLNFTLTK